MRSAIDLLDFSGAKMEVASRLAGRVDVHCHSRMILSIWFSDNMKYIGIAQLEGLRTTISRRLRWNTQIGEKVPESGSEPAALHYNRHELVSYKSIVNRLRNPSLPSGKPCKFAFLLLRILRREIGYNFLETWVAAQRIPARVQFQITIA